MNFAQAFKAMPVIFDDLPKRTSDRYLTRPTSRFVMRISWVAATVQTATNTADTTRNERLRVLLALPDRESNDLRNSL